MKYAIVMAALSGLLVSCSVPQTTYSSSPAVESVVPSPLLHSQAFSNLYDETPLHQAADEGHTDICKILLAHGAEINAVDADGETPLAEALEDNHWETAKFLLDNGVDSSIKMEGMSIVQWLQKKGKVEEAQKSGVYGLLKKR